MDFHYYKKQWLNDSIIHDRVDTDTETQKGRDQFRNPGIDSE
jgi:hypothetical protein